ncbi:CR1 protein, partial [Chionis minor]|nr:CR1 protein [Chionis minor]
GDCPQPPRFTFAEPSAPLEEPYPVGVKLRYRCRPGYTMEGGGSPVVTCGDDSMWSWTPNFCIGKSCRPPDITNGNFDSVPDLRFGATVTYTCNVGYRLVGRDSAQCILKDNEVYWDHIPHCDIIPCLPPPGIKNGRIINGQEDFTYGMVVTYTCDENFSLIGDDKIHCMTDDNMNGKWSGPAPECKVVRCENPGVENGKKLSGFSTEHSYKNTVTFECNPGYVLRGSRVVTCEADSTWKPPLPICEQVQCGPAPRFPFAELTSPASNTSPVGTKLTYQCKPGYTQAGGKSSVVTCQSDSRWSSDPEFCTKQQCTPPKIENGDVTADSFSFGAVVTFTCHPGYELKGPSSATCVASGNGVAWNAAFPHCERQRSDEFCKEPPAIENGMHNGTNSRSFVRGSVVAYKCKDGFTLTGQAFLRCVAGDHHQGVWSKPAPECRGDSLLRLSCCLLSVFKITIFSF